MHQSSVKPGNPRCTILGFFFMLLLPATLFAQCPPTVTIIPLSGSTQVTGNTVAMCSGDSVLLNAAPAAGVSHQWYNELGAMPGADTSFLFVKQPGLYYVMVSGCALPSQQVSISLKPKPIITLTPSVYPPHICSGDTINITVTTIPPSVQWTWFQPPAAFGTSLNPLSLILFTATTYLVVGVNNDPSNGCSNTASMQVQVDFPIDGGLIGFNDTICAGEIPDSIVSLAPPSGGSGTYTYVWSYSNVGPTGPWTLIPGETGMGYQPGPLYDTTWFSRAASSPPCSSGWTPPIEVIVHSYPSVTNAGTDSICTGNTLNFIPLSNVPGTTFAWTASVTSPGVNVTGWSASGTGPISDPLFLDPGTSVPGEVTYVITPIGPEPTLCAGVPSNLVVTVNPIPTVINSPMSQEICSGGATTLVVLQSAVAGTHFTWYATTQPGISGYQPTGNDSIPVQTILSTRTDSGYVYYHITPYGPDPTNCQGPEVVYSILVKPSPTVTNFPMYQYICSGDTSQEVILTSNVAGTTFVWTSSASPGVTGNTPSGTDIIPPEPLLNPGTVQGQVTYHIIPSGNLFACPATPRDYIIYVDPIPSITSSLSESVCSNAPFSYTITSNVNGSTFTWERLSNSGILNPGTSGIGFTINETLINITGSPVTVTYILTPTGPVPTSCAGVTATMYLTVNPLPVVDAGSDVTINCGTSTQLNGSASGGVGTLSYTWNPPALIQSGLNTLTPVTVNLSSSVIFTLIVTDNTTSCQKSDVVQVNITGPCLSVSPTATPSTICLGQISHLNANPLGGSGTYSFFWSAPGFNSTEPTPDVAPTVTTTYHVIVDDGYSSVNGNVTVTVNPLPALYNVTGGGEFCSGGAGVPVGLSGSQLQTNYVLQRTGWQSPPVPGTGGAITFGNINSGGLYTVIATNIVTGCTRQMNGSATVIANPLPQVNAGADQVIPYGTSTVLSGIALGGTGTLGYQWTPGTSIFSGQGTLTPQTTNLYINTEFTLTVTDEKSCIGTDNVWVYLSGDPLSVAATASPSVICNNGQNVYLSAVAAGGSGTYGYSWSSVPSGFIPPGQNPVVNPTVTTSYIVTASDGYNLARDTVVVTVNPLPAHYSVTGGGSYCSGGAGVPIGLTGSQLNVNYQLTGAPGPPIIIPGTGGPVSFGNITAAFTYHVFAVNTLTGCYDTMPGSATVVILPLPDVYAVTGGGTYSAGGAGVPIGLAGSQTGITYRLIVGNDTIPDPALPGLPGTGYPISFGNQTQAGTYVAYGTNDITGCVSMMSGSATVIIDPWPAVFNVTGGGPYCAGDTGVHIGLTGSETNVTYHLKLDGVQHTNFPGNGNPLDFGLFQSAGLYTVTATNNTSLFTLPMTGNATVTVNPLPDQYLLGPGGLQCAGTEIYLNGSDTGIRYTLYHGSDSVTTVQGTGNPGFLSFGNIGSPGTYTAVATNNATGCDIPMIGSTSIVELPEIFTLIPSGILCAGQTLGLTGSQTGVSYQLRRDGMFNAGAPVAGTGGPVSFGPQTIPGSYTVIATSITAPFCAVQMTGTRLLYPMPVSYTMVPEGDTCAPVSIGLNGSQTGVTYYLLLNGSYPPVDTLPGTGGILWFPETTVPGSYTIRAGNDYSLCDTLMNGSLTVHPFPIAYQITPQGTVCAGTSVGVENSELFVSYQLILNDTMTVGSPVAGNGGPITFGPQQIPGNYTVIAVYTIAPTCSGMMSGTITLSPLPDMFNIIPAGNHCAGSIIGLAGSQPGIKYKLILNNQVNNPIDSIIGTGNAISFGPRPLAGTYRIIAFNETTSCQQTMNDSVVLAPLPLVYSVIPLGPACEPQQIGLSHSENGVIYKLYKNGLPVIPPVTATGTGAPIFFGMQNRGTYTVRAENLLTGCTSMMNDSTVVEPRPFVNAGSDTVICSADSAHLSAFLLFTSTIQWNTSGDGLFTSPASAQTTYVPGINDQLSGSVILSATANGVSTCAGVQLTDSLLLTIHPAPAADAGPELWICSPDSAYPNGSATHYSAAFWSTSGDGTFLNGSTLDPVYIPGPADTTAGSAILTLTVTGSGGCSLKQASDQTLVHFAPLPVAIAGNDTNICAGTSLALSASALHYDTLMWHTSGDGIFSDPHLLNPVYFPGTLDQSNGTVTLTLQASGNGFCTQEEATDSLILTIDPNPVANAGPDTIICANATYQPVSQASHYTTVFWSTSGDGHFNDPSLLSPAYNPGPSDTTVGSAVLTMSVNGSLSCLSGADSDEMILHIAPMPVPDAGADSMVCAGSPYQLHGSAIHAGTVLWTTTGDGTFSDPAIYQPLYNHGTADQINGSVNLVLNTWGVQQCGSGVNRDTMFLIVQPLPSGHISGSTSICRGDSATVSVQLTGVAPWSISYTDGQNTISVNGIPLSPYNFRVSPLVTTSYQLTMVQDQHCYGTLMTGAAVVTVLPLPTTYNMTATGNGGYCEGGPGVTLGLEHSDTGIEYQLWFAGLPAGNLVAGTGGPIILGQKSSPGTYKVRARNLTTLCHTWMEDSVLVHILPLPLVDYYADSACINAPTQFHLTGPDLLAITTWHWDFGDGNSAVYNYPFEPEHIYAASSSYTVTLTATDTSGCIRIRTHQVTVDPLPVSFFTFTTPGCSGNPIHFTDLSYTQTSTYINRWDWNFGDGTDSTVLWPGNPDVDHTYPGAGTYPVSLKVYTPEGCMHTVIRNVTVSSAPLANFMASASCNHEPTQFTDLSQQNGGGNIIEWNWNFGDPGSGINNTSTLQNPVHIYQVPGLYTVKLITMNVKGCTDTITKEINTQSRPTALFEAPDTCHGTLTQFTDLSVTAGGAIIEWDWDFGDNTAHSNQQHPVHLYNLPGTYQVTLQVKNSHQCIHDTTLSVTVIAAPTAAFTTNAPVCAGQPVYFYNQSHTTNGQIVKWHWEFGDGADTTIWYPGIPNVAHVYNGSGIIYLARLTVTTNDSCTGFLEIPLQTLASPLANFSAANTRCELTPLQFSDLSQFNGGPPIISWSWNFDDPASGLSNISTQQNPLHSFTSNGDYDVSLIVRNLNNCTDTIIKTIGVNELPESVFIYDTACLGEVTHFTDASIPNAGSIVAWLWHFGDGTSGSTLPNPQHLYANPGTYTVTLTVTNSNLCTDVSTAQVIVRPEPVAAFTFSTVNCAGSPVTFTNQSTTPQGYMVQWIWDFGDGNSTTVNFPDPPDVTHVYTSGGSYNVTLTVKNSDSCTDQSTHTVSVSANPLANFTSSSGNCEEVPVQFTDLSQQNGGGPIVNWYWDFGDPGSGTANQSTQQNPLHVYQYAGTYTVRLIVKNVSFCYDTIEKSVAVGESPQAGFSSDTVCRGNPTQFTDLSSATSGSIVAWNWDFGDGTPNSQQQNPVHLYAEAGSYTVTLTATSSNGCSHDTTQFAIVREIPQAAFSYSGQCEDSPVQFTDLSLPGYGVLTSWYWDFGDGDTSTLQNPVHIFSTTGVFNVTLTVTNLHGCTDSVMIPLAILPRPQAAFTYHSVYCPAGQVAFSDHSTAAGTSVVQWLWEFEPGFTSGLPNPVYLYAITDTTYTVTLTVTDLNGCSDTATDSTIFVKHAFEFSFTADTACHGSPTHFAPVILAPGDTLNDITWKFGEPASGSNNTSHQYFPQHTYINPGSYIVMLKGFNSDNCVDSVYREIFVQERPLASFSFDEFPHCDSVMHFTNLSSGLSTTIDTLICYFGDGTDTTFNDSIPAEFYHKYPHFGTFQVTMIAINHLNCSDTITRMVPVTCIRAGFIREASEACQNTPVMLTDTSGPSGLIDTWQWFFGDGTDTTYTTFTDSIYHKFRVAGTNEIVLVVASLSGGSLVTDTSRQTILITPGPLPAFTASMVCSGDSTRFTDLSDTNGVTLQSRLWRFGDASAAPSDTSTLIHPVYRYPSHGNYTATLMMTNILGCTDSVSHSIRVSRLPVAGFTHTLPCIRYPIVFSDLSQEGDTSLTLYQWYMDDPDHPYDSLNGKEVIHTYGKTGLKQVVLKVTDKSGCQDTAKLKIDLLPTPVSIFTLKENMDGIPGRVQFYNKTEDAAGYQWNFGNGQGSVLKDPFVIYRDDGTYLITLVSWNEAGCHDTTSLSYEFVYETLYIPNAFHPTSNVIDVRLFKPKGINLGRYHIQVFDKWGTLLWESTALDDLGRPMESWDGYFNGNLMPQDTYMWKVSASFKNGKVWEGSNNGTGIISTMGSVVLIR